MMLRWDLEKGKVTQEFKQELETKAVLETGYLDGLHDLAFSRDGKLLASADTDWNVRLLDAETGKAKHTLDRHTSVVLAAAFAPDGKTVVSASFDDTVRVWDTGTGKELQTLQGIRGRVVAIAFSPDGKVLATGGVGEKGGGEAVLWA
jgi:WD40 repeat protein